MEKYQFYTKYRNGIIIPLLIGIILFFIFYLYSRFTSPDVEIIFNDALYSLAITVMIAFFICLVLFFLSIFKYYFSKSGKENNPQYLLHHLQFPLSLPKYRLVFIVSTLLYFIFFGLLSNIFIYFINDTTIFSIFPTNIKSHNNDNVNGSHNDHDENDKYMSNSVQNDITYPNYKLIICCNYMGYVPMLIFQVNQNVSILVIPINLLIGVSLSVLVGLNVTLNIFTLFKIRSLKLSKKDFYGLVGISTGLFVGCPTCTGSLFYSLVGFSSLILFSSLSFYQALFIIISIPLLLGSILFMMKILKDYYLKSCKVK